MPVSHHHTRSKPAPGSAIPIAVISLASALSLAAPAQAQEAPPSQTPGNALASMIGSWEGSGWSTMPDGSRETFDIFERVESVGGGNAVMIRGMGYAPAGAGRDGRLVHDAGGFVSREGAAYQMFAATAQGGPERYEMTITETGYVWEIPLGPQARMVFTAHIDAQTWTETGEYCQSEGACFPSMSMTLTRLAG